MGMAGPNPQTKAPPSYVLGKLPKWAEAGGGVAREREAGVGEDGSGQWALQGWRELRGEECESDLCQEQQQRGRGPRGQYGPGWAVQRRGRHRLSSPSCSLSRRGSPARVGHPPWVPHCPLPNSCRVTHRTTHTWSTWRPPLRPDDGDYVQEGAVPAKCTQPLWRGAAGTSEPLVRHSLCPWGQRVLAIYLTKGLGQVPGLGTGLRISLPAAGAGEIASACREKGHVYGRSYSGISQKQTQRMGRAHIVGEVGKWSRTSAEG